MEMRDAAVIALSMEVAPKGFPPPVRNPAVPCAARLRVERDRWHTLDEPSWSVQFCRTATLACALAFHKWCRADRPARSPPVAPPNWHRPCSRNAGIATEQRCAPVPLTRCHPKDLPLVHIEDSASVRTKRHGAPCLRIRRRLVPRTSSQSPGLRRLEAARPLCGTQLVVGGLVNVSATNAPSAPSS